jgi:hypothetical protein
MARRKKAYERLAGPRWGAAGSLGPTVTVKCTCGQRALLAYTYELDGVTYGADGYQMGGRWIEATPYPGGMGATIKNIVDEDWWRFLCGRCGRDWRGRQVQIAGLVRRAQALSQVTASLEFLPSPADAYCAGARHTYDRPNRWRDGDPTKPEPANRWVW